MSLACCVPLVECVYCLACTRWICNRCLHTADDDSETWARASAVEFEPIPRLCRMILAVYEDDIEHPLWAPPRGYGIDPRTLILRKTYEQTGGRAPPYLIYVDHVNSDIVLAIRGLNLAKESDYAVLLDNRLGEQKFDGGYVHNGLLKSAAWILDAECQVLKVLLGEHPDYTLTVAGHSLGAGVAAMLAMLLVQNRQRLNDVERKRVRCYAMAPARCMSLNLAVRYADVINSVVLQDDFLPRTATPLENVFKSLFCLPCVQFLRCLMDACVPEVNMFMDPRRLYAPGRLYHIVNRKPFQCGRITPEVRTAVPVDGRFEHVVLSCNATSDHAIIWIERESQRALDHMWEGVPETQRMERREVVTRGHVEEHRTALRRAVMLAVPHAVSPTAYGTFEELPATTAAGSDESWKELIQRLFDVDPGGHTTR
ncbi:uncharacterized protein LOC144700022 [Wolffia australiana]